MISFSIRSYCILAAVLLCAVHSRAQVHSVPGSDAKLTPSVTGNSSLGNISNPNLFDGSTTVNVPIYSYATDAGDLGISLSYNTKGIKVDELAEHVGVHWSLNAGGTITRVLKDLPDEVWDANYQALGTPNPPIPYPMIGRMYWYNLTPAQIAEQQNNRFYHDSESDDFIVSAGRLSFTFNIGKDGQVFSHPHTNARVKFLRNGVPVTMPTELFTPDADYETFSFVITDTEGNSYYFEKGNVQYKACYDGRISANDVVATKPYIAQWVIKKIVLTSGAQVVYNYTAVPVGEAYVYKAATGVEKQGNADIVVYNEVMQEGMVTDLQSINYPNGVTATFLYRANPQDRCDNRNVRILDTIKIGSGSNAIKYRLKHVYAMSPGTTFTSGTEKPLEGNCASMVSGPLQASLSHRLRLKGIDIVSNDNTKSEPYYTFNYDMTPMPRRLYGNQDFFGYSRGFKAGDSVNFDFRLVPSHPSLTTGNTYGIDKTAVPEAIKAGNLISVANAYGGKSEFVYEAHQLSTVMTGLPTDALFLGKGQSDGLRLKSIIESDIHHPGSLTSTSFSYTDGQIFLDGGYFHYPVRTSETNALTVSEYNIGGIYATAHQLISGSNHGYSQVTSEVRGEANQLISRKVTNFTNFKDENGQLRTYISGGGKKFFEYPYSDKQYIRDWEIGLPTTEVLYDQNGRISNMQANYFRFTIDSSAKSYVYNTKKLETIPGNWVHTTFSAYNLYAYDNYSPYTGKALLESTVTRKYVNDNTYISDVVSYTYDSRNNLKTTMTRNSEGQDIYSRNVYNYDLSGPGVLQPAPFGTTLWYMNDVGLEKVIGQERWLKAGSNSPYSDLLLDASTFGFRMANNGYWVTNWMHNLVSGAPIPYTTYTGISGPGSGLNEYGKIRASYDIGGTVAPSRFRRTSEVLARDAGNNPVEVQLLGKEKYNAMIWDVSTGNKLADVANARYNEIGYTSFELPQISTQNNMVTDGRFTYDQGDINYGVNAISGKGAYQIGTVFGNTPITVAGLTADKSYIVGFWAKDGVPVFSGAGAGTVAFTALKSQSGWTYYEGKFSPASTGTMTFSSTTALYLDDLRLFPADAQMVTATYDPFLGKTSAGDAAGRISYMEYDKLGRPTLVRDQEGNILSKTEYQVNP